VNPDGKYQPGIGERESYTLFWLPMYSEGLPFSRDQWMQDLSHSTVIDLSGILGPAGETYMISIKEKESAWRGGDDASGARLTPRVKRLRAISPIFTTSAEDSARSGLEEIFIFGKNEALVGRASYEVSTGALEDIISIPRHGLSLVRGEDNLSRTKFINLLIPFVFVIGAALISYEIFYSSVKEARRKTGGMPIQIDFAFFGYTAVLVDIYLDFAFHDFIGPAGLVLIHGFVCLLFWFRFGIWALLPVIELGLALLAMAFFKQLSPVMIFFPASICSWLMCLLVQGAVSPGVMPEIKFIEKMKREY